MAYYARSDEDLARLAIAVTASLEDPGYVATNLITDNVGPAKLVTTSGWWVLEFAEPISPIAAALIYQYLDDDLLVWIQGNDSDTWDTPGFEAQFTIPAKRKDGPSYQRWTRNTLLRFEVDEEDPPSYRFWRLWIDDENVNSQQVAIGRLLLLSALHRVDLFLDSDMAESDRDEADTIVQPTELGVETFIVLGGPRRSVSPLLIATDLSAGTAPVQGAADFRALYEATDGRSLPFLFVPLPDDEPWLGRFEPGAGTRTHKLGGYQVWPFTFKEVSRGLPWP